MTTHAEPATERRAMHRALRAAMAIACAAWLAACGGGDGRGEDTIGTPQPGARCAGCQEGRLTGTVSAGRPLAGAHVVVRDAAGAQAEGSTDAEGVYDIDLSGLNGALIVQATGTAGGRAMRLHGAARRDEAGIEAVNVTPLTELVVADVLGGDPGDLLQHGRAELQRIDAAVAGSGTRVEQTVRAVLDAAGAPAEIDLRLARVAAGSPMATALAAIDVTAAGGSYRLRHLAVSPAQAVSFSPAGPANAALPAPGVQASSDLAAGQAAMADIASRLAELAALYAGGVPATAALEPFVAADLRHGGLGAAEYIEQGLRRQDPAARGGFSLQGLQIDDLWLREVQDGGQRLRVSFRLVPRAPHPPVDETMWFVRTGGTWRLQGDGLAARVRVRNAALLGPRGLDGAAVRGLAGAVCTVPSVVLTAEARERCSIDGGQGDVPSGGWLDLGAVDEPGFGLRALYRSDAADPLQRLADYAAHSRRLGEPSAQVSRHLLLEVDALQVDPRAARVVVTGPGLPAQGLVLHPPQREATSLPFSHWTVDPTGRQDWHGVPQGHCGEGVDAAACAAAWASLASGTAYRFVLLDAEGGVVDTLEAALPIPPIGEAALLAQRERWFGRWALEGQPLLQPTLARLMGAAAAPAAAEGDALVLTQPWHGPSAARRRPLFADVEWHRAALPPAEANPQIVRQRWPIEGPGGALAGSLAARSGYRTVWLSLLLTSADEWGNLYLHSVSPDNPH